MSLCVYKRASSGIINVKSSKLYKHEKKTILVDVKNLSSGQLFRLRLVKLLMSADHSVADPRGVGFF